MLTLQFIALCGAVIFLPLSFMALLGYLGK